MQAVILAGGLGTRLRPLTERLPKPMMPVQGRPFLEYLLTSLAEQGIRDVILCVGYRWRDIKDYFEDGARCGVQIRYSIEPRPLGTGGAVKAASAFIHGAFILINGDTYLRLALKPFLAAAQAHENCLGMVVASERPYDNNLRLDAHGRIVAYQKLGDPSMTHTDAGVACYRPEVLSGLSSCPDQFAWEELVYQRLISQGALHGYRTPTSFYDIGTVDRLRQAIPILAAP